MITANQIEHPPTTTVTFETVPSHLLRRAVEIGGVELVTQESFDRIVGIIVDDCLLWNDWAPDVNPNHVTNATEAQMTQSKMELVLSYLTHAFNLSYYRQYPSSNCFDFALWWCGWDADGHPTTTKACNKLLPYCTPLVDTDLAIPEGHIGLIAHPGYRYYDTEVQHALVPFDGRCLQIIARTGGLAFTTAVDQLEEYRHIVKTSDMANWGPSGRPTPSEVRLFIIDGTSQYIQDMIGEAGREPKHAKPLPAEEWQGINSYHTLVHA